MTDHLTREQLLDFMAKHKACSPATTWVKTTRGTPAQLYAECENPQWMLWLAGKAGLRLPLVLAAAAIARSVLKYVPAGEARPAAAIEVAARLGRDELTGVAAQDAAGNAAYAAEAAGDAARAAMLSRAAAELPEEAAWAAASYAAEAARAAAWAAASYAAEAAWDVPGYVSAAAGNAAWAAAYVYAGNAEAAQNQTSAKAVRKNIPWAMLARAIKDRL